MTMRRAALAFGLAVFGLGPLGLGLWGWPLATVPAAAAERETNERSMDFDDCVRVIEQAARHLGLGYADIADTDTLRVVRFPVSDGSVLVTCSRFDDTITVTKTDEKCGDDVEC